MELVAVLELELQRPFKVSVADVLDLADLWQCDLIRVSTQSAYASIAMPTSSFKKIWGTNPRLGHWVVPVGTEDFLAGVEVTEVRQKLSNQ